MFHFLLVHHLEKCNTLDNLFFLCKYVGGEFGTGDGPEYNNDPKYIDSGKFIPEIIKKEDVKTLLLLPTEIRDKFVEDIEKGNL